MLTQANTISSLVQHGTGNMVQATEVRRNKYESKLDSIGYFWSHRHKVIHSHTSNIGTDEEEGHQEADTKITP